MIWSVIFLFFFFFFSSRRRHTRLVSDWSSDVCSSDLFFDMPMIGGWDSVRGLDDFRFLDKSAISFGAEYRFRIWTHMDWGFFVDERSEERRVGKECRSRWLRC